MAELLVKDDVVTVSLSAAEKAEALHGDVSIPRAAVVSARIVPDGMDEVHGLRLPGQPVFYPVLNEEYAAKIARDWNVPRSGAGYVTRFQVLRSFLDRYEVHQAGGKTILEYWIPAGDLRSNILPNIVLETRSTDFAKSQFRPTGRGRGR